MNKFKFTKLFFVLTLIIAIFPACNRSRNAGKTMPEVQMRYGFTTEPATLDPLNPENTADGRSILFNVFEGLVKPDTKGIMQPCIAESWTIEQNGLIYNFTLREGILFHDGSLLKPSDVKFSLETAIKAGFGFLSQIESVLISGDNHNQIRVILSSPDTEFLPYMTAGIVKAESYERYKNNIGTGPFYIESYTPQKDLILKKFDNYWQPDIPKLNKVTILFFANNDAQMIALRGGSIDGTNITGSMAAQLDTRSFDIINSYSAAVQLLALNNAQAPFNDIRVRQALNYGIDVQNIIDAAFFGMGNSSASPIIPGLSVYYENNPYPYNPGKAQTLLAEAGYDFNNQLTFEITVPSNYTMHVDTAQVIVNQLEQIGIKTSIKLVDGASWLTDIYFGRQYQATIISLDSQNVSPRSFLSRYRSGSSDNFINFSSMDFDKIYDNILAETNETTRIQFYKQAQFAVVENAASVFLQDIFYFKVFRGGRFSGVLNYPLYVIDFSTIYITEQ
jgi:peptide/nickel transport system substrate-binding protein